jgi:hypothetical protein
MAGAPGYLADFDSAAGMLRAASNVLARDDFPAVGQPRAMKAVARVPNLLPKSAREQVFALGGAFEAIGPTKLGQVDAEAVAEWATGRYPERSYQAVAIGSSNGAISHLAAAFDMPWLPQTFFIPVRHLGGDPDDPKKALAFGRDHAGPLLDANPDLQLHHMHDGNQDRLMVSYMDYFRVKRRRLGAAYERFFASRLAPGGTILVIECEQRWPTTRIGPRHVFQHGAVGGATVKEFHEGGPRVAEYLERYGSDRRRWDSPEPDGESPEAEWGFEPALRDDILRFARVHGFEVRRLVFPAPMDLSPLVADFHRDWYRRRGLRANRLLVESFIMHEPYWALRTGSVPYWMVFNMKPSADALESYLDGREPFDEIELMLFNHGVEAVGFADIPRWEAILGRARRRGRFLGVRPDLHPRDFGALGRYHDAVQTIPARYPLPNPLPLSRLVDFIERSDGRYGVRLLDGEAG